jgi:drug/metabolite transporter (DMT)-like permease
MTTQRRAEAYLLVATFIWGSTFVLAKFIVTENSPLLYSAARFMLASAILFVIFPRRLSKFPASALRRGGILGALLFAGFALQTVGQQYTTASKSAFFTGTLVVLTPVLQIVVQRFSKTAKRALTAGNIIGVFFAAAGLYCMTSPSGSAFNAGDGLTLGAAFLFALYIIYLDAASAEPDKLQLIFIQFLFSGIAGLICAPLFETMRVVPSAGVIMAFLYLTIFATVIASWLQNRYQGDTTPTRAAVIFSAEPVIAALFAYEFRGEEIGLIGIIGGGLIVSGVLLSEFSDLLPGLRRPVGKSGV